jgi:hypothetical protein
MKALDAMITWTPDFSYLPNYPNAPNAGQVRVVRYGNDYPHGHPERQDRSIGACDLWWRQCTDLERIARLFIEFNTLVVRDRIDPQVAHREFLKIDEYRTHIALDIPGAEESPEGASSSASGVLVIEKLRG